MSIKKNSVFIFNRLQFNRCIPLNTYAYILNFIPFLFHSLYLMIIRKIYSKIYIIAVLKVNYFDLILLYGVLSIFMYLGKTCKKIKWVINTLGKCASWCLNFTFMAPCDKNILKSNLLNQYLSSSFCSSPRTVLSISFTFKYN